MILLFWSIKYLKAMPYIGLYRANLDGEDLIFSKIIIVNEAQLTINYPDAIIYKRIYSYHEWREISTTPIANPFE